MQYSGFWCFVFLQYLEIVITRQMFFRHPPCSAQINFCACFVRHGDFYKIRGYKNQEYTTIFCSHVDRPTTWRHKNTSGSRSPIPPSGRFWPTLGAQFSLIPVFTRTRNTKSFLQPRWLPKTMEPPMEPQKYTQPEIPNPLIPTILVEAGCTFV